MTNTMQAMKEITGIFENALARQQTATRSELVADIETVAAHYKRVKAQIANLEKTLDSLKQILVNEMDDLHTTELTAGPYTIRNTPVETTRLDATKLKNDLPDLCKTYSVTSTHNRFSVS